MVDKLLKFLLLISPLAFTAGIQPDKFELMFFHFGAIALFMASLLDIPKRDNIPIAKEIVLFFGLCIFSTAIHSFQMFSMGELFNLFFSCITLNLIYRYMSNPKTYYKYITWAVGINIGIYLLQKYYFNFLPFKDLGEVNGGVFGTTCRMANYLAITAPIIITPLLFIIPVISIILNQFPAIGVVAMLFIIKQTTKKDYYGSHIFKLVIAAIVSGIIGFLIYFRGHILTSIKSRIFDSGKMQIAEICKAPFIGHGLGAYYSQVGNDPFNTYLAFVYDVGILGLVLIGYVLYNIRKYFDLSIPSLSLITLLVVSTIEYPIEIPRLWFTILFIIAAFFIKEKEPENASS